MANKNAMIAYVNDIILHNVAHFSLFHFADFSILVLVKSIRKKTELS